MATPQGNTDPEKVTQDVAMPATEQQTPDAVTPTETVETQTTEGKDAQGLPEGVKERTAREFEKLREQLREERTRREYFEGVFTSMNTPQPQTPQPVYDPETGLINENVVTQAQLQAQEAIQRAQRAEASVAQYLYEQEQKEAYAKHPELADELFATQAQGLMYHSQVNPDKYGGRQLSLGEAASYLKSIQKPIAEKTKAQVQKETLESLAPKEQASLEATGEARSLPEDDQTLVYESRRGNQDALAVRLSKIPR